MKRPILCAAMLLAAFVSFSLEVREGRLKLVVHEDTGRFSLYYLVDIQNDRYSPLYVDKDPRTTFATLLLDDRAHRLGESTSFRFRAERDEGGAKLLFESPTLSATQRFTFARLSGSTLADAVRVDFVLLNKSERDQSVGLRLVVDTDLAEKKAVHFKTESKEISAETVLAAGRDQDGWWVSEGEGLSLMGSFAPPGLEPPDSIHFANWKRLNDAPWKAQSSVGRNFNLLPYSINDSALSYYFEPKTIARGAERTVSVLLGVANPNGFAGLGAAAGGGLSRILQTSVEAAASPELALQTDLITIRDLLARVELLLKEPEKASDEEIAALEAVVARLKERNSGK